ncbi:fibronectin type III domain-containing protein [Candidatus Microgenomates bacterium]|nr:fibronectin type III domain-containing protein [Candidatus Microgenomates bacterium]
MAKKLLALVFLAIALFLPRPAQAASQTITEVVDSHVDQIYRDVNFGSSTAVQLTHSANERHEQYGLFKFNTFSVSRTLPIYSAYVKFYVVLESGACTLQLMPITQNWFENSVTWNNMPNRQCEYDQCPKLTVEQSGSYRFDVTPIAKDWVSRQKPNYGFMITTAEPPGECRIISKDSSVTRSRPLLELNYTSLNEIITISPTIRNIYVSPTFTPTPSPRPTVYMVTEMDIPVVTSDEAEFVWRTIKNPGGPWPSTSWVFLSTSADINTPLSNFNLRFGRNDEAVNHLVPVSGLEPNTKYYYRTFSHDNQGHRAFSQFGELTTKNSTVNQTISGTTTPTSTSVPNNSSPTNPSADLLDVTLPEGLIAENETEASPSTNSSGVKPNSEKESNNNNTPVTKILLTDSLNSNNASVLGLIILIAVVIVLVLVFFLKRRTTQEDKVEKESSENLETPNQPKPSRKRIFIFGLVIVVIIFTLSQMSSFLAFQLPGSGQKSEIANSSDYYAEYLNSSAKIDYQTPAQDIVDASFDCQKYDLLPDKSKKYLCKNIYNTDENQLKNDVLEQRPDRIFLYGQYLYYDCPAQSTKAKNPVSDCFLSARFIDNWQIPKMREMFGVQFPDKKIYYYLTETLQETKDLCGKLTKEGKDADACFNRLNNTIFAPAYNSDQSMFMGIVSGLFFEGGRDNQSKTTYKAQLFLPKNCYLTDNHEIIHSLNSITWKNMPVWLDEGLVALLQNTVRKKICPPGMKAVQVVRIENDQEIFVSETFDPDSLDWEEPLSTKLIDLSANSVCRQGIFLEIAKNIHNGGSLYLKSLYKALGENHKENENYVAETVWKSSGQDASVKDSLLQHQCSF